MLLPYKNIEEKRRKTRDYMRLRRKNDPLYLLHQRVIMKIRRERHKRAVLNYYSGEENRCNCCGEQNIKFLTIDHINNDGAEHRKSINLRGGELASWIVVNHFPEGFQILCYNCNMGKNRNKGICPHNDGYK